MTVGAKAPLEEVISEPRPEGKRGGELGTAWQTLPVGPSRPNLWEGLVETVVGGARSWKGSLGAR